MNIIIHFYLNAFAVRCDKKNVTEFSIHTLECILNNIFQTLVS